MIKKTPLHNAIVALGSMALLMISGGYAAAMPSTFQVTFSDSVGPQFTDLDGIELELPAFDNVLGRLTQVEVRLEAFGSANAFARNSSNNPTPFFLEGELDFFFNINGAGFEQFLDIITLSTANESDADIFGRIELAAREERLFGPFSFGGSSTVIIDENELSSFSGYGSDTLATLCSTLGSVRQSGGGGNTAFGVTTTAGCSAEVTYTYVPAPASMLLMACGLIGLQRKKSHSPLS